MIIEVKLYLKPSQSIGDMRYRVTLGGENYLVPHNVVIFHVTDDINKALNHYKPDEVDTAVISINYNII